jgi:cellobiose phosphorylase
LPDLWGKVKIEKNFRGKKIFLTIKNENKNGSKDLYLNGIKLRSNYISEDRLKEENEITIII